MLKHKLLVQIDQQLTHNFIVRVGILLYRLITQQEKLETFRMQVSIEVPELTHSFVITDTKGVRTKSSLQ